MAYQAEYIWIDGTTPTPLLRSKTKILADGKQPPIWGFDGSSTNQASGEASDCQLKPVFICPDPIRGGHNVLVLCDVHSAIDDKPHPTNTRAPLEKVAKKYSKHEMIYGIEQEYTFLKPDGTPLGFPSGGYPAPQGPYYCGVGTGRVIGREIIEEHTQACIDAGLMIEGHQRRGDARSVGVPDRRRRCPDGGRPHVRRPLAAAPHRRGLRRGRVVRCQARQG